MGTAMFKDFLNDERGSSAVEYGILVAAIAALLVSAMGQLYKNGFPGTGGAGEQLLKPNKGS
jgi:Flp pilus assembly pilin Flp